VAALSAKSRSAGVAHGSKMDMSIVVMVFLLPLQESFFKFAGGAVVVLLLLLLISGPP
jgi:hypothetical protein